MRQAFLNGKQLDLNPQLLLGQGGEAEVYDLGEGQAGKIYKPPDHPDYRGNSTQQRGATKRLKLIQQKLPAFPDGMPSGVVIPRELIRDNRGQITGYTMRKVANADPLSWYSRRDFRQAVAQDSVQELFKTLRELTLGIHQNGAVIGDYNDLNVLIKNQRAFIIDADSFRYGEFPCMAFTPRFADPLISKLDSGVLILDQQPNQESDWYAFAALLFKCLLLVEPFGGIYRRDGKLVRPPTRQLDGVSVLDSDVRYPKPAYPPRILPDELLNYFQQVFTQGKREPFPGRFLQLDWQKCPNCGLEYAVSRCPACQTLALASKTIADDSQIAVRVVFETDGYLLDFFWDSQPRWLYRRGEQLFDESDQPLIKAKVPTRTVAAYGRKQTLLKLGAQALVVDQAGQVERLYCDPAPLGHNAASNHRQIFWLENGQLKRNRPVSPLTVGEVLRNQTMVWAGSEFGFGLYRAGRIQNAFVFSTDQPGINDSIKLAPIPGQITEAGCVFSDQFCWLTLAYVTQGDLVYRCVVVDATGQIHASFESTADADPWLASTSRGCAIGSFLLVPTDEGVKRIEVNNNQLRVAKHFEKTKPYVGGADRLHPGKDKLYVIKERKILSLKLQ